MTAFGILVLASVAAAPATGGPAKLLIFKGSGVAVADYPSMARCEQARAHIAAMLERVNSPQPVERLPNGGTITKLPVIIDTLCIPG